MSTCCDALLAHIGRWARLWAFHMSHLMLLSGVKRTWACALQMSAFDPKRTLVRRGTRLTDLRGVQF
jgi:hypothetical protein